MKKNNETQQQRETDSAARNSIIRSNGRKRSRGLSDSQREALEGRSCDEYRLSLPTAMQNPADLFADLFVAFSNDSTHKSAPHSAYKIYVEIGFGAGEHLVQNATQNPNVGFIGCEPFENGAAKALKAVQLNNLKNVKIYKGDARDWLKFCSNESVDRFYVLFPDPWTKKRHHKRRLLSEEFVVSFLYSKLKPHGEVVIATDCTDYMAEILEFLKKKKRTQLNLQQ